MYNVIPRAGTVVCPNPMELEDNDASGTVMGTTIGAAGVITAAIVVSPWTRFLSNNLASALGKFNIT